MIVRTLALWQKHFEKHYLGYNGKLKNNLVSIPVDTFD